MRPKTKSDNPTRLSGTEHKMLALIAELGEAYGLQIHRHTKGGFRQGTIYVILSRLTKKEFLTSYRVPLPEGESGPSRVAYRVTPTGVLALRSWAAAEAVWSAHEEEVGKEEAPL